MSKRKAIARREVPPTHLVMVDTNILWFEDKSFAVSPDFEKFWNANTSLISLELALSEIVVGELKFQQTTSALKRLKNASVEIEEISKITSCKHVNKISENVVRGQVDQKVDKWLQSYKALVIDVPIHAVDWKKLINAAIWREAPFTFDPKDKVNEKGFRDALILETFLSLCRKNENTNKNIVFVCADYLLRETTKQRVARNEKILIFESLQDFGAYIQLTQKNLTDKFVKEIQKRARIKFWQKSRADCIYYKNKIYDTIVEKFQSQISAPLFSQGLFGLGQNWYLQSSGRFIGATQFQNLLGQHEFHWISRVIIPQLFSNKEKPSLGDLFIQAPTPLMSQPLPSPELQKIRLLNFDVLWSAKVKADGRFHDNEVKEIRSGETEIVEATQENLKRWGFGG